MSSLHLRPFQYFEPASIHDAVELLNTCGDAAHILAGGVDLIPRLRTGAISADYIINIQNIPELNYIKCDGADGLEFGAMATLHALELSLELRRGYPTLYDAIHNITSVQSKCMGTAAGNLCVATPSSDVATALMALNGVLIIAGRSGARRERIADFYTGYRRTTLKRGELVIGVFVPKPAIGEMSTFLNLVRTHADCAKVAVAVSVLTDNGACKEARIALGAVAPTVYRADAAEKMLSGRELNSEGIAAAAEAAAASTAPITDLRSTADYRREMTKVLVGRALTKVAAKAGRN